MASAITHGFVAVVLGKTYTAEKMPLRFWALAVFCSILPDFDVIGFYFGVRYGDMFGHRGFFHSFTFALILGLLVALLAFRDVPRFSKKWWGLVALFSAVTASHGLLDAMTTGGYGIGLFIPFSKTRYFLPWRPLAVSPIGIHTFFSHWGINVILSEMIWVWIPGLLFFAAVSAYRRKSSRASNPPA